MRNEKSQLTDPRMMLLDQIGFNWGGIRVGSRSADEVDPFNPTPSTSSTHEPGILSPEMAIPVTTTNTTTTTTTMEPEDEVNEPTVDAIHVDENMAVDV